MADANSAVNLEEIRTQSATLDNLVVMQYFPHSRPVQIRYLNDTNIPGLSVDTKNNTWSCQNGNEKNKGKKIGEHIFVYGHPGGRPRSSIIHVIGVYDITKIQHLENMVNAASTAKGDTYEPTDNYDSL